MIVRDHLAFHWGARLGSQVFARTIMVGAGAALFFSVTTIFIVESLVLLSLYTTEKGLRARLLCYCHWHSAMLLSRTTLLDLRA